MIQYCTYHPHTTHNGISGMWVMELFIYIIPFTDTKYDYYYSCLVRKFKWQPSHLCSLPPVLFIANSLASFPPPPHTLSFSMPPTLPFLFLPLLLLPCTFFIFSLQLFSPFLTHCVTTSLTFFFSTSPTTSPYFHSLLTLPPPYIPSHHVMTPSLPSSLPLSLYCSLEVLLPPLLSPLDNNVRLDP